MKILCTYTSPQTPALPSATNLRVLWANRSVWPTNHPVFCCEVDSVDPDQPGVLQILTDAEADELYAAELQAQYDNTAEKVRRERDRIFAATVDRLNPLRWSELSESERAEWSAFRQALKDVTSQAGFPFDVQWPTVPGTA